MEIEGPIEIGVVDQPETGVRELHIRFREAFRQLELADQGREFAVYLEDLKRQSQAAPEGSAEQRGILTVMQIVEQLLPHIQSGEIPLSETLVVEIQHQPTIDDLIRQNSTH